MYTHSFGIVQYVYRKLKGIFRKRRRMTILPWQKHMGQPQHRNRTHYDDNSRAAEHRAPHNIIRLLMREYKYMNDWDWASGMGIECVE